MDVAGDRMRNAALPVIRMIPSSTRLLCPSVSAWINLPVALVATAANPS
jgi:hypothetical protein